MKNRSYPFHFLFISIFLSLFTQKTVAQEFPDSLKNLIPNRVGATLDVFALDLGLNLTFRLSKDFSIGIEGELGANLSDPISLKFADFQVRDDLLGILGGALFVKIHNIKSLEIDIGYRGEYWYGGNLSDGGFYAEQFNGIYTKLFFTPNIQVTEKGFRYKPSLGLRLSTGYFKIPSNTQNRYKALLFNLWIRIPLSDNQLYVEKIK